MTDMTTKVLLGLIAIGLWANIATTLLGSIKAVAQGEVDLSNIENSLGSIEGGLGAIESGTCVSSKIC